MKYNVKQHPTLNDIISGVTLLPYFVSSLSLPDLHNCADVATLLVADLDHYGLVNNNTGEAADCRTHQSIIPKTSTIYRFRHLSYHYLQSLYFLLQSWPCSSSSSWCTPGSD